MGRIIQRIFFIILLIISTASFSQNIFDLDHSLPYIHSLISKRDYTPAQKEIDRLKSVYPSADTLDYLTLYNCEVHDKWSIFFKELNELCNKADSITSNVAVYAIRHSFYKDSITLSKKILTKSKIHDPQKKLIVFHIYLYDLDTLNADQTITNLNADTALLCYNSSLLLNSAYGIKKRNPALAATLSTVLPGSGKMYSSQWKDGLMDVALLGLFAFQSWHGFYQKGVGSVYGWVFAGFTTTFYGGNIYGAYRAAKRYNSKQLRIYHAQIKESFICSVH